MVCVFTCYCVISCLFSVPSLKLFFLLFVAFRACVRCGVHSTAMKPTEIQDKLGLTMNNFRQRNWYVQPACALSGDGLHEGLTWLMSNHKWCYILFTTYSFLYNKKHCFSSTSCLLRRTKAELAQPDRFHRDRATIVYSNFLFNLLNNFYFPFALSSWTCSYLLVSVYILFFKHYIQPTPFTLPPWHTNWTPTNQCN